MAYFLVFQLRQRLQYFGNGQLMGNSKCIVTLFVNWYSTHDMYIKCGTTLN